MKTQSKWGNAPTFFLQDLQGKKLGKNILDLGCGDGRNTLYLLQNNFQVTAVDIDIPSLNALRESARKIQKEDQLTIIEQDITTFQSDKQYDTILINFVLHFLTPNEYKSCIENIYHLLPKGGILIVSDFYGQGFLKHDKKYFWFQEGDIEQLTQNRYKIVSLIKTEMKTRAGGKHNGFEIVMKKP